MLEYLAIPLVTIFVVGLCCFVLWILSVFAGWRSLAAVYAARTRPEGAVRYMQSAYIGSVVYTRCLTVRLCRAGIYLSVWPLFRVGHPPLLIPWSDLRQWRERKTLFMLLVEADIGRPAITTIALPYRLLEEAGKLGYATAPRAKGPC
jgi:hypothetical protein